MSNILEINQIKKRFGSKEVLKGVSFEVPEHTVFGFVGQNGAGKTTTMKATLGLLNLDDGEILVNGMPVKYGNNTTNRIIGYLPDVPEFYSYMTPKEYLRFCGELSGMDAKTITTRSNEMLERVGLGNEKHRIKGFSRGQKQRLGVAQALLHRPKLLICDEPTSALDPVGRKELMDILTSVKEETTVVFSTHILSDVEKICDNIAFLHQGQIVMSGAMADIKNKHKTNDLVITFENEVAAKLFAEKYPNSTLLPGGKVKFDKITDDGKYLILNEITTNRIDFESISHSEWCLEDLFMEVALS